MANTITTNDQTKIIDMFNNISSTYDLLNRLLSFGIDQRWRKTACKKVLKQMESDTLTVTDVACGTGDMLIAWKETAGKLGKNIETFVGVDPSVGMLEVAKQKISWSNFKEGKATELPFEDSSVDIISITYGIRNVVDLNSAFQEFYRVLKPGGRLVILEFTKQEKENSLDRFARWYLHRMIPIIGGLISKDKGAYKYLPDSIAGFITSNELNQIQKNAGFEIVETKDYSFKISTMFITKKPLGHL